MADVLLAPIPVAPFPNVPFAAGIPAMARPTAAINAVLNGPAGLNATLANAQAVQSIIGGLSNASTLIAAVPGAQQLLSVSAAAQTLLYRVPGLPLVLQNVNAAQSLVTSTLGLASVLTNVGPVQRLIAGPTTNAAKTPDQPWGIFDSSNNPVVVPDAVIKFEFLKDWKIMDYPVEQGSFQSYNKVETPFTARLVLAKGGSIDTVTSFLAALTVAAASMDIYNVSTPQWVYQGVNIDHIDWSQEASRGAYLLQASVWLQEIIQVTSAPGSAQTQQPSGADPVSDGVVQTQPLSATNNPFTGNIFFGG